MKRRLAALTPLQTAVLAVAVLTAVWLIGWGSLIFGRRILFFGDLALYFVPLLDVQRGALLLHHRIALWDPYTLCGKPVVGNPQSWPLYPSSLLLYALPAEVVTGVTGALHLLFAALGTFLFLHRGERKSPFAGLLGALTWGFGGALVSKMQFPNMVQAASYLPWLLWSADAVLASLPGSRLRNAAVFGLLVGLALLAAHPQMFLMNIYVLVAWVVWRLTEKKVGCGKACAWLIAAFLLGVALAAGQLLPTMELARVSVRPTLTLAKANRFILPPYAALYNFLLPNFYGNPASETLFVARGNYWEGCVYCGILPFALAVGAAFATWRTQRETRFWTVTAVLCFWLALGRDAGLFAVAFRFLPGLSRFHDPARWAIPGTFALACLAAEGLDSLLAAWPRIDSRRLVAVSVIGLAAADLLVFDASLNPTASPDLFAAAREHPAAAAASGRVFAADEGKTWGRYVNYRSYAAVAGAGGFVTSGCPNLPVLAQTPQFGGYEPVSRADIGALEDAVRAAAVATQPLRPLPPATIRLLRAGGVVAISRAGVGGAAAQTTLLPAAWGRAQLWTDWHGGVSTKADSLTAVLRPDWDGVPVVVGSQADASLPAAGVAATPVSLTVTQPQDDETIVTLPTNHPGGLVVLADTLSPGWRAFVNRGEVPIVCVDGAFRGIFVGAADRKVRFRYEPESVRVGIFISFVAAGILTAAFSAAAVGGAARRRVRRPNVPGIPSITLPPNRRLPKVLPRRTNGITGAEQEDGRLED